MPTLIATEHPDTTGPFDCPTCAGKGQTEKFVRCTNCLGHGRLFVDARGVGVWLTEREEWAS